MNLPVSFYLSNRKFLVIYMAHILLLLDNAAGNWLDRTGILSPLPTPLSPWVLDLAPSEISSFGVCIALYNPKLGVCGPGRHIYQAFSVVC